MQLGLMNEWIAFCIIVNFLFYMYAYVYLLFLLYDKSIADPRTHVSCIELSMSWKKWVTSYNEIFKHNEKGYWNAKQVYYY